MNITPGWQTSPANQSWSFDANGTITPPDPKNSPVQEEHVNSDNYHKIVSSYFLPIEGTVSHEDMKRSMQLLREQAIREIAEYILDNKLFELSKEFDINRNAERVWVCCYVGNVPK